MKLVKVTVDLRSLKNEVSRLHAETAQMTHADANEQRAYLKRLVEELQTLKTRLENDDIR